MEYVEVKTQAELDTLGSNQVGVVRQGDFVAWGSSHVEARDTSHVVARGSSHVEAWGSSHVVARGSSHVEAWGSSHVEAWDTSHVVARDFVSVHRYLDSRAKIICYGQAVEIVPNYPSDVRGWCALKGIEIASNDTILLWKAVRANGTDFRTGTVQYDTDRETVDPNWRPDYDGECGYALHLSDSPSGARYFVPSDVTETFRLLQVRAAIADCLVFGGSPEYPMKLRARACRFVKEFGRDYWEGEELETLT